MKRGDFREARKGGPQGRQANKGPRGVSLKKDLGGTFFGDYEPRRNNRVFAHRHSADDRCAGCDPYVSFNHDGFCDCEGAPPNGSTGWPDVMMLTFGPIITSSAMSSPPRS